MDPILHSEEDTFRKLKQIPWKEAVDRMLDDIIVYDPKTYEDSVSFVMQCQTNLAESMGWKIEDFIEIQPSGIPIYNRKTMETRNGKY